MSIKALIPVRSGSLRVKNKNIKAFAGSSLLEIKIKQMLRIKEKGLIDEVVVNSNDDTMLDIALNLGAKPIKRDEYFASNEVSINEVLVDFAKNLPCEDFILANATSPLISDESIIECIKRYLAQKGEFDSLTTATLVKEFLWLDNKPINYDLKAKPRSQDLPDIMLLSNAFYILPRELVIQKRDVVGDKCQFVFLSKLESVDIDDEFDFEVAEFLYKKYRLGGGVLNV